VSAEPERGERARLFAALMLDARTCARLVTWAREAIGGEPRKDGVRLLGAEALHLTLCFLGSVPLSAVDDITGTLREAVGASRADPPAFSPAEVRWLPPRRPRVCALSLHDLGGRGETLRSALAARLHEGGWYAPERRRWLAHVTVARVGRGGRPQRAADPAPPRLEPFPATAVTLMRSWPGSRYEALARMEL
jgi:2'-5' RNA ligase